LAQKELSRSGQKVTRKILITGGAGFIGYHLAVRLAGDTENQITLLDNFSRGQKDGLFEALAGQPNVKSLSLDITKEPAFNNLDGDYDEVYHFAAMLGVRNVLEKPHEVLRVNSIATLFLLDWFCKSKSKKIVFASTSEVYAWTHKIMPLPIPTPEEIPLALTDIEDPRSTYAASKIFGELSVRQYCKVYQKPFTIVRYHNIYGPRMGTQHVIPEMCFRILGGENPLAVYSPENTRSFCYVSDAIEATLLAMREKTAEGGTFNIGNDAEEIKILDLSKKILKKLGIQVPVVSKAVTHDPVSRRCPDLKKARTLLNYKPKVSLEEGLAVTLDWYRDQFSK
jgi:UDP-glucose 4-epimerase